MNNTKILPENQDYFSIGLDVSKKTIDICMLGDNIQKNMKIDNSIKGINKFMETISSIGVRKKVPLILESTGDCHLLACLLLSKAGYSVKEINPIITKQYISKSIRGAKTDKIDSSILAKIGIIDGDKLMTFNRDISIIDASKKISLISTLEENIQSLKLSIKNYTKTLNELGLDISEATKIVEKTIKELENSLKLLQKEVETLEFENPDENKAIEIIDSIIGVSTYAAKVFYVKFAHKNFASKESMYAFVGFDPKLKQSGTSINTNKGISKRGDSYVRKKLYQIAFCAIQHYSGFKDKYNNLKLRGKHHFVCVIGVVKFIINLIRSLLKRNTLFDPNYLNT
ncbi:MAG: transposase [Candidatus Absconditabacteria bacterium]